ncbi:HAMP domain-containing sensor histidine kinase [Pedobacter sp. Du54]|uniref:sensor histidine kinase n=1 Tax=Pedobacter anseongensis TaxID=3133439 RepID=UPI0030A71DA5
MRLFTRYNQVLLTASSIGLLIIGYLFYLTLSYYLNKQVDRYLIEEQLEVKDYANKNEISEAHVAFKDLIVDYIKIDKVSKERKFADTVFYNPKKGIKESARYLKEDLYLRGRPYRVIIMVSKVTRAEQAESVTLIIVLPVLALLLILLFLHRIMMKQLWRPFKEIVSNLKSFNLNQDGNFIPVRTSIQEFKELNKALTDISLKIRSDYREIKLFTENASHEMMTPIAIINSKLDMMLQAQNLSEEQSKHLSDLYKATSKLTKLNQSLLLLVKIDHNLLRDDEEIDLKQLIKEKINYFNELLINKNIEIAQKFSDKSILMSKYLADILMDNLIGNAIRHNYNGGKINIELNTNELIVRNTSTQTALDPLHAFERFHKSPSSEGMGLGLAIVKQIATSQHFNITYSYSNGEHEFKIKF